MIRRLFILIIISIGLIINHNIYADNELLQKSIDYRDIGLDMNLAETQFDTYNKINTVSICNIKSSKLYIPDGSNEWIKSLYYEYITNYQFMDIPYNYVYDGYNFYTTRKTEYKNDLEGFTDINNSILIGIYDLENNLINSKLFIEEILSNYGLKNTDIRIGDCSMSTKSVNSINIGVLKLDQTKDKDLLNTVSTFTTKNANMDKEIKLLVNVKDVQISSDIYSNSKITIQLTNDSDEVMHRGMEIYVKSISVYNLYVNTWVSPEKILFLQDNIFPDETKEYVFEISTPIIPGEYEIKFDIVSDMYPNIKNTLSTKLSIQSRGYKYLKIKNNEFGFLNVRKDPSPYSEILTKVNPESIFVYTEENGSWVKILLDKDKSGWVAKSYIEYIEF